MNILHKLNILPRFKGIIFSKCNSIKFDFFNKSILPILYHGIEVWCLNDSSKLEGKQSCTCLQKIF